MIINTLVSDLSCEHVAKFVFVDEHDRCETLTQERRLLMREYDGEEVLMPGTWRWPGFRRKSMMQVRL